MKKFLFELDYLAIDNKNKTDELIFLFDEFISLSLAVRVFFSGENYNNALICLSITKSFSLDTSYKTTS